MNADGCTNRFRCVQCGFPIDTLYIQYSPGNIRLMKCEYCKVVADEYIECEVMILIIDLILHKPQAYRHLFYNRFSKEAVNFQGLLWKSVFAFLLLDIYRMWTLRMNENEWTLPATVVSFLLDFGKMFTRVVLENLIFLAVMIHGTGKLLSASARVFGWKEVSLIVIISSYFKIFLMATMVWKFPSSVIFIIDMFVISSNYVALKVVEAVITDSMMMRCLTVCLVAHGLKFLSCQGLIVQC
ncbi:protein ARV 2-like isoform X1 [Primulina huaijiensis]|uniref:protein ARV 2-like isoform X1 n=1 Tax=Primulina huaijiensis TaxID=1492673 RepID=UPI003CC75339